MILSDCFEAHINDVALFTTDAIAKTMFSSAAHISQLCLVSQKYGDFALIPDVMTFHTASSFIYSIFFFHHTLVWILEGYCPLFLLTMIQGITKVSLCIKNIPYLARNENIS